MDRVLHCPRAEKLAGMDGPFFGVITDKAEWWAMRRQLHVLRGVGQVRFGDSDR
jgi:hypothetical protein